MSTFLRHNHTLAWLYAASVAVVGGLLAWSCLTADSDGPGYPHVEISTQVSVEDDWSGSIAETVTLRPDWDSTDSELSPSQIETLCEDTGPDIDAHSILGLYPDGGVEVNYQSWNRHDPADGCSLRKTITWGPAEGDPARRLLRGVSEFVNDRSETLGGIDLVGTGLWYAAASRHAGVGLFTDELSGEFPVTGSMEIRLPGEPFVAGHYEHGQTPVATPDGGVRWTWTAEDDAGVTDAWFRSNTPDDSLGRWTFAVAVGAIIMWVLGLFGPERRTSGRRDRNN